MKAVENANDTLAQSGAAHDTVVDYDEIVNVRLQTSVGDVIDMSRKVIPAVAFSNESAELYHNQWQEESDLPVSCLIPCARDKCRNHYRD